MHRPLNITVMGDYKVTMQFVMFLGTFSPSRGCGQGIISEEFASLLTWQQQCCNLTLAPFLSCSEYCCSCDLLLCLASTPWPVGLSTVAEGNSHQRRHLHFHGDGVHLWLLAVCVHSHCGEQANMVERGGVINIYIFLPKLCSLLPTLLCCRQISIC